MGLDTIKCSKHSLNCFRTWMVIIKNLTPEFNNYFDLLTNVLNIHVPIKIKRSNRYLSVNFVSGLDDREKDFRNLAMYMQPLGFAATAFIQNNEDYDKRINEINEQYTKLHETFNYLNSILLIFSDNSRPPQPLPAQCGYVVHNLNDTTFTKTTLDSIIQHFTLYLTKISIILQSKIVDYSGFKPSKDIFKCGIESSFENELDSKLVKKIMGARHNKLIGDINLLLGNFSKSIYFYNVSIEILSNFDDNLWIAACLEGVACACYFLINAEIHDKCLFKIDVNTHRSASDGVDIDNRYRDTVTRGTEKYLLDSLEYFRRYFGEVPMYVEYHLTAVLLNFYLINKVNINNILELCSSKYINRILSIDYLNDKLGLLELHMKALNKVQCFRKCAFIVFYFTDLVLKFKSVKYYKKTEESLIKILNLTKFDERFLDFSKRWGKIHITVLNNLINLYTLQNKNKEAIRIQLLFLSTARNFDSFTKKFDEMLVSSDEEIIRAYQPLPIFNSVNFSVSDTIKLFRNVNISHSNQTSPFIFKAINKNIDDDCFVFAINQTLSIFFEFYNPLPIVLTAHIIILTDPTDFLMDNTDKIVIQPRSSTTHEFKIRAYKDTFFEIVGYESLFFGMKSFQKLSSLKFQSVRAHSIIETKLVSLTNSFETKFKSNPCGTDLYFEAYEGSIIDCKLKIKEVGDFKPNQIFIKSRHNLISVENREMIFDKNCILDFKIGDISDPWSLPIGNYKIKIHINAFTSDNEWTISHTVSIEFRVHVHLVVEYFSLLPKNNTPETSLCRLHLFNLTSQDANLHVSNNDKMLIEQKSSYMIKSYSRQNIKIDFPKSEIDKFLDLVKNNYSEDFFHRYFLNNVTITWEKTIDNVNITGNLISKFSIQKDYFINFLLLPYINIDFLMGDDETIKKRSIQCNTDSVLNIHVTATNNMKYDLSKLNISLFSGKMFDAEKSILWLGSISKKYNIIKSQEKVNFKFQLLILRPGSYTLDLIAQTDENEKVQDQLSQFFKITDSQLPNTMIESYFSKKSITSNTYISCLALEVIHIEAKVPN